MLPFNIEKDCTHLLQILRLLFHLKKCDTLWS